MGKGWRPAHQERRLVRAARQADVVVLQRVLPQRWLLRLFARINSALVLDFDDALYTVPGLRARLRSALQASAEVVAGSEELARHVRPMSRSVTVIPTVVDPRNYNVELPRASRAPVRVGWIGTGV